MTAHVNRILIVGMLDSVHLARWLEAIDQTGREIFLFASGPHRRVHRRVQRMTSGNSRVRIVGPAPWTAIGLWLVDHVLPIGLRARWLRRTINNIKPSVLHAMEMQHAGYVAERALRACSSSIPFVMTLWGSDVNWFATARRHKRRIVSVLKRSTIVISECDRDLRTCSTLGYRGRKIKIISLTGGLTDAEFDRATQLTPTSQRRVICVKGYSGFMGRAPLALRGVVGAVGRDRSWSIAVYAASWYTFVWAMLLRVACRVDVTAHRKGRLNATELEEMFASARLSVMISRSDGFPAALKESMLYGAVPVMADTSCASELLGSEGGMVVVRHPTRESIRSAVGSVLTRDSKIDEWTRRNQELLRTSFSEPEYRSRVELTYAAALAEA